MLKKTVALFSFLLVSSASIANHASPFYFIGNSLTDMGNVENTPPFQDAPVTNAGGRVWAEVLASRFGDDLTASKNDGTNFANSGAVSDATPEPSSQPLTGKQQVTQILSRGIDKSAIFFTLIGGNDLLNLVFGSTPSNTPMQAATNIVTQIQRLALAGAKYQVVLNLPENNIPLFTNTGISAAILPLLAEFNRTLSNQLNALPQNIVQLDVKNFFNNVFTNPMAYGFSSNAPTTPCPDNASACTGYLFISDGFHLTSQAHSVLADYVYSVITAPSFFATLPTVAIAVNRSQQRLIFQQLGPNRAQKNHPGWELIVAGSFIPELTFSTNAYQDYNYNSNNQGVGIIGFNHQNSVPEFSWGGAFAYNNGNVHLNNPNSFLDNKAYILDVFASYQWKKLFISGLVNYGWLDFPNLVRKPNIGSLQQCIQGSTTGRQAGIAVSASYLPFQIRNIDFGPIAELNYQHVNVNGYHEQSAERGYALTFQDESIYQTTGGLGARAVSEIEFEQLKLGIHLFAIYNKIWTPSVRDIFFNVNTLPGSHGVLPVGPLEADYTTIGLNLRSVFKNGLALSTSYVVNVGQQHLRQHTLNLALSLPLN